MPLNLNTSKLLLCSITSYHKIYWNKKKWSCLFVTKQSFCNRSLLITGQTLVSFACSNLITKGLVEQVSYILDKGADPTIVDIDGLNAVSYACPVLSSMFVWCYTRWNCIIFTPPCILLIKQWCILFFTATSFMR